MASHRYSEWQPIRHYGAGAQPRTGRHWNCLPAWDVTAVHRGPDAEIPHPDFFRAKAGQPVDPRNRDKKKFVFWDRHVDRRFYIEYANATKDSPRVQSVMRDPDKEWDALIGIRDGYLRDAGLTLKSEPEQIAKCLADSFGAGSYFKDKPLCPAFPPATARALNNGIEGLMYQSHCVGCSKAYVLLVDSIGLPARNLGCDGHWVAEVLVGGTDAQARPSWHMVDSAGRHEELRGTDLFFKHDYMECCTDPMGDHGEQIEKMRDGFWRRMNPQFHFHCGTWASPATLRYATGNAHALYPQSKRLAVFSYDGKRLPILSSAAGFYWPLVHNDWDGAELARGRMSGYPMPLSPTPRTHDYFFHPFRGGEKLRQSFYLGGLDDLEQIELVLTFAPSGASDFSAEAGRQLILKIGDFEKSLTDLNAWPPLFPDGNPPTNPTSGEMLRSTISLPRDLFQPDRVNWIELHQRGKGVHYVPFVPAVLEPYIAPLWTETVDAHQPPLPVK